MFGYTRIQLFTEINGKITNIDFANGQNKLSNCVTFSYDRDTLIFVPDGDPFEVNKNSSFSDYLDFAGYHFESVEAMETIVESIIDKRLIPNLGKADDIFLFIQAFQYESKEFSTNEEGHIDVCLFDKKYIKGHNIYSYDSDLLHKININRIRKIIGHNVLIGYPFLSIFVQDVDNTYQRVIAPTLEKNIIKKVEEQYPLPTHIPEKLFRNIKNKIITSKLLGLPLPEETIYQNRRVDIAKTNLYQHFDEILKADAKEFIKDVEKVADAPVFIFDFGMYPIIKESFLTCIDKPVFMDKKDNEAFIAFLLRSMMIQFEMNNDPLFKKDAIKRVKDATFAKYGSSLYYSYSFIEAYIKHYNKKNILSNIETKELESLCYDKLKN